MILGKVAYDAQNIFRRVPMAKLNTILQYDLYAKNETGFMSLCKYLTLAMQVIALAHEALCIFFSAQ